MKVVDFKFQLVLEDGKIVDIINPSCSEMPAKLFVSTLGKICEVLECDN